MKSLFEEMGGIYTLGTDGMYDPNLALPKEEPHYGKYGRMRLQYLKEHRKVLYRLSFFENILTFGKEIKIFFINVTVRSYPEKVFLAAFCTTLLCIY